MKPSVLLSLENLSKTFVVQQRELQAVQSVSLDILKGETLGLVGESGCGKSTLGRTIMGLYPTTEGRIVFDGHDLTHLSPKQLKPWRRRMQMVFQDPYASLNPRMTVEDIIGEALDIHRLTVRRNRRDKVEELLDLVGLLPGHITRYPHEFSGGQRQRIGIARALAVKPDFLLCDEALSALDVSVQAQIVELLRRLQAQMNLTYLFIAHDLSMVKYLSDRVAVMYLGNLMELAGSEELYSQPLHPYTQALLSAIPVPDPIKERQRNRIVLKGDVPSPLHPPTGCVFHTRCPFATEHCGKQKPEWREVRKGHHVACHYAGEVFGQPPS